MKSEFYGCIPDVREVEDCIRSTKKYTKGAFTPKTVYPTQDVKSPVKSKVTTEYYEVYPDLELSWDMSASDAWAWVWGDISRIDVRFYYDYRSNRAKVIIFGGPPAVDELSSGIEGLSVLLLRLECQDSSSLPYMSPEPRETQEVTSEAKGG